MSNFLKIAAWLIAILSIGGAIAIFDMTRPLLADPTIALVVDPVRWSTTVTLVAVGILQAALLYAFATLVENSEAIKFATQALARAEYERSRPDRPT